VANSSFDARDFVFTCSAIVLVPRGSVHQNSASLEIVQNFCPLQSEL
jgi:hypothetical protein